VNERENVSLTSQKDAGVAHTCSGAYFTSDISVDPAHEKPCIFTAHDVPETPFTRATRIRAQTRPTRFRYHRPSFRYKNSRARNLTKFPRDGQTLNGLDCTNSPVRLDTLRTTTRRPIDSTASIRQFDSTPVFAPFSTGLQRLLQNAQPRAAPKRSQSRNP
jgi:hypothetical protein